MVHYLIIDSFIKWSEIFNKDTYIYNKSSIEL